MAGVISSEIDLCTYRCIHYFLHTQDASLHLLSQRHWHDADCTGLARKAMSPFLTTPSTVETKTGPDLPFHCLHSVFPYLGPAHLR